MTILNRILLGSVLFLSFLFPLVSQAAITVPWSATSTDTGAISPNVVNGNNPSLKVLSTATSTFSNGLNVTAGCFSIAGVCVGTGGGAVSSVFGRTGTVVATAGDYTTALVTEVTNLYFTNARAIAATLTGFSATSGSCVSTDSIEQCLQRLAGNGATYLTNITGLITNGTGIGLSGSGTSGSPYSISNTGVTSIVAGTNITVSGSTGAVTINSTGGGTGTNYFTNSGANTYLNTGSNLEAPSFTATSTTATSTFNGDVWIGSTGVLPNPDLRIGTSSVPLYGRLLGDLIDAEYDYNGVSSINVANANVGPCAASTYFSDGNNPTLGGYYGTFSFLNDGWTNGGGAGCGIGVSNTDKAEAVAIASPTGEMDFDIASTTNTGSADFNWDVNNVRVMKLSNAGALAIGTTSTPAQLTVANSSTLDGYFINTGTFGSGGGAGMSGLTAFLPSIGDRLSFLTGGFWNGSSAMNSTAIQSIATQNWTAGSAEGTALNLQVTPNGSATRSTAMTVDQSGFVGIGTTTPSALLALSLNNYVSNLPMPAFTIASTSAGGIATTSLFSVFPQGSGGFITNGGTVQINSQLDCKGTAGSCNFSYINGGRMSFQSAGITFSGGTSATLPTFLFNGNSESALATTANVPWMELGSNQTRTHATGAVAENDQLQFIPMTDTFASGAPAASVITTDDYAALIGMPLIGARGSIVNRIGMLIAPNVYSDGPSSGSIASSTYDEDMYIAAGVNAYASGLSDKTATDLILNYFNSSNVGIGTSYQNINLLDIGSSTPDSSSEVTIENLPAGNYRNISGTPSANYSPTAPIFRIASTTNSTQTADVTIFTALNNGNVGVGTSTPWLQFSTTGRVALSGLTPSSGLQTGVLCLSSSNEVINDSIACLASAKRYKEDIADFSPSTALSQILALNPVTFLYKKDFNGAFQSNPNYSRTQLGLIADDVGKVNPAFEVVETATTTFEGKTYAPGAAAAVDYNEVDAALVGAVKAEQAEILALKVPIARDLEDNWQNAAIAVLTFLFAVYVIYNEIDKRKKYGY